MSELHCTFTRQHEPVRFEAVVACRLTSDPKSQNWITFKEIHDIAAGPLVLESAPGVPVSGSPRITLPIKPKQLRLNASIQLRQHLQTNGFLPRLARNGLYGHLVLGFGSLVKDGPDGVLAVVIPWEKATKVPDIMESCKCYNHPGKIKEVQV